MFRRHLIIVETYYSNRKISTSNEMVGLPLAVARNGSVVHIGSTNNRNMYAHLSDHLQKFENAKIEEARREQSESHESFDEQF